jgi:hypothetical protein
MKKFTFLLLLVMVPVLVFAQTAKRTAIHKAPVVVNDQMGTLKANFHPGKTLADGNYIAVDTSNSGLGPSIATLNPLAYDPYSGTACYFHRNLTLTYGAGHTSGQLWYNISTDFGVTWTRVAGGVNTTNSQTSGRYPSMCLSNPTKDHTINGTIAAFSWPELTAAGAFGWVGYAADQPAGAGSPSAFLDQGTADIQYSSQTTDWASDNTPDIFWTADYGTPTTVVGVDLWQTADYATVNKYSPPQWSDSVFNDGGEIMLGGQAYNGVQYFAVVGTFNEFYAPNPVSFGWFPGVSKSTDQGATWSDFKVCDWRTIPALANYDELYSWGGAASFRAEGDINVDKNGHAHLLVELADTTVDNSTYKKVCIADLFETATGWDATIVADDIDTAAANLWNNATNQAVGQMGPSPYLAFDSTRTIMAVQYNNKTTPVSADIFLRYKNLSDTKWSAAQNLTNSDSTNNVETHFAPFIKTSYVGKTANCTVFSMYGYEVGNTSPTGNGNNKTALFLGAENFSLLTTGINDPKTTVNSFALSQNYPNPFNPSTMLNYTLPQKSNVTLKVYDVLGKEVANLVNATQEAGNHSVNFNASKLASGLYIYTLKAGNNVMSKKMMLLK